MKVKVMDVIQFFCFSMQPKSEMKNLAVFIFHATICVTFFEPWLESR